MKCRVIMACISEDQIQTLQSPSSESGSSTELGGGAKRDVFEWDNDDIYRDVHDSSTEVAESTTSKSRCVAERARLLNLAPQGNKVHESWKCLRAQRRRRRDLFLHGKLGGGQRQGDAVRGHAVGITGAGERLRRRRELTFN